MNTFAGLAGIFGVVLTMAMSPFAELLPLSGLQLAIFRGLPGVILLGLVAMLAKKIVGLPDKKTLFSATLFAIATVGVFNGIKAWGANLTIIMLDLAVLVPIVLASMRGEKVGRPTLIAFSVAIAGSFLSLRIWDVKSIAFAGLGWSLIALIFNGLFIEYFGKADQNKHTKVFWLSLVVLLTGLFGFADGLPELSTGQLLGVFGLGLAMGVVNFYLAVLAFANLKPIIVGVLILAITPATILSSYLILGKTFGIDQFVGVLITLSAVWYIGFSTTKTKEIPK